MKTSATRLVITTWTHEYAPGPMQLRGTGEPGSAVGGDLTVTLLLKPVVLAQGTPLTSNHVALNEVGALWSQALE